MAKAKVVIRVDANPQIGLGHLKRCSVLAGQLRMDGFDVQIVSRERVSDEAEDAARTLSVIGQHPKDLSWVIVDHYGLGERWESIVRAAGHKILAIDDFRNRSHCADILVSDSDAPFDPALNRCVGKTLIGPKFALIGPEFTFSKNRGSEGKKQILISYGGSDPTGETTKALQALQILGQSDNDWLAGIHVVIGPANTQKNDLVRLAAPIAAVTVHDAPESLAPLLGQAHLVLTAGGNTLVEALAMGKPCIVTSTHDNQALMVGQLRERDLIVSLGDHRAVSPVDIARAVTALVSRYDDWARRVESRPLFDHLGASRISKAIQNEIYNH